MEYRLLGQLEVRRDGVSLPLGTFKQRAVLALLLVHRNEVVSIDRILDDLWGEEGAGGRKNALHVYLSNLRKVLEPERSSRASGSVLLARAPGYLIRTDGDEVDADWFARLVAEGRGLLDTDPGSASIVLGEALALWRGLPLEEFTYESFAQPEITRLGELRLEAVEARVDADLAHGRTRELVGELEGLAREHPLRERFTAQLMLALYRSGRQAEALRAYRLLRSRLSEELGIEPTPELHRLNEQMVIGDPALAPTAHAVQAVQSTSGLAIRGYELRERIGGGSLGIVHRAFQPAIGREVAVKVVRAEYANDPAFVRRFETEAQIVARLEHPHIVPLYDYWREPGAAYLVMRLLQGGSLGAALTSRPWAREEAAALVSQLSDALCSAHRAGVVHGDVKPENILLDTSGNAYLCDFGIAVGSAADGGDGSPTSDVHDLAVVVAQVLAGRRGEIRSCSPV